MESEYTPQNFNDMIWTRNQLPKECTVYPKDGTVKYWLEDSTFYERGSPFILPKLPTNVSMVKSGEYEGRKALKEKIFKEMSPMAKRIFGKRLGIEFSEKGNEEGDAGDEKEEEKAETEEPSSEYEVTWVMRKFIFKPLVFIRFGNIDFKKETFEEGPRVRHALNIYEKWFDLGVQKWVEDFGSVHNERISYDIFNA